MFFFDEAHLLFNDAPKALLERIELVVRLVRSKGVGVYFVTQNPLDIPDTVLAQLGNRVQHALRAFTPRDQKAVKAAAETMRHNPGLDIETAITELAVGEALVSFLDEKGRPGVTERVYVLPPGSQIGPITPRAAPDPDCRVAWWPACTKGRWTGSRPSKPSRAAPRRAWPMPATAERGRTSHVPGQPSPATPSSAATPSTAGRRRRGAACWTAWAHAGRRRTPHPGQRRRATVQERGQRRSAARWAARSSAACWAAFLAASARIDPAQRATKHAITHTGNIMTTMNRPQQPQRPLSSTTRWCSTS